MNFQMNKIIMLLLLMVSFCKIAEVHAESGKKVIATINGKSVTYGDVFVNNDQKMYDLQKQLFDMQSQQLQNYLIDQVIKLDQRSKGLTSRQFLDRFVVSQINITDEAVDQFIVQANIPAERINANLKAQARQYLSQQEYQNQVYVWFEAQRKKHKIELLLEAPAVPRFSVNTVGAPYTGGNSYRYVTIVEFSDFQCPYCAKAQQTLRELQKIYGNKIKLVYKHFPLDSIHPEARKAAEATFCAQEQSMNKFWELHDKFFDDFRNLKVGIMKDMAKDIGLDSMQFNQCLDSSKYAERVDQDFKEGISLGVESTPAFFINGRFLRGAQPLENFVEIIDEELSYW